VLRFFKRGINKVWYIDDRFPWDHNKQGVFCQVISDGLYTEIWPLLLEKAYAKIHKHYEVTNFGRPEQALVDLTNGIPEVISFKSKDFIKMKNDGTLWQKLWKAFNEGHLIWASSIKQVDNTKELGILEWHSYSVLFFIQVLQIKN